MEQVFDMPIIAQARNSRCDVTGNPSKRPRLICVTGRMYAGDDMNNKNRLARLLEYRRHLILSEQESTTPECRLFIQTQIRRLDAELIEERKQKGGKAA